jgi:hypothetical protein
MQLLPTRGTPGPLSALTLGELRLLIPTRPHVRTIENWCDRGVRRQTLRFEWHGGRRYTCLQWYDDFNRRIEEARQ